MYGFPQKCPFTAPSERDWNEMETFLGNQVFLSRWSGGNPDFCTPISCRTGDRQSMGQKKPVDIHDKEYAWKWFIAQSNVPFAYQEFDIPIGFALAAQMYYSRIRLPRTWDQFRPAASRSNRCRRGAVT